jgi:hypothetical protein
MLSSDTRGYPASYDSTTKLISAIVCAVLIVLAVIAPTIVVAVLGALFLLVSYAYSPRGYAIAERAIVVKRLVGDARIPLDAVREARAATPDDFRGCLRLWGNGGLFGYYGLFRTSKLGKSTWYVTSKKRAVIVVTAAKTVVLSPDDVDGFLAAVRAAAPMTSVNAPSLDSLPSGGVASWFGSAIGGLVAVAAIAAVAFGVLYSPGPPDCTLTAESLTIHDRFYPVTLNRADVDIAHVRTVDFAVDTEWRPTARDRGFANSHYHSGWFRLANRQTVRLYRADGARLVLLPPSGNGPAVLLESKDPDKLIDDLRAAWPLRP